jgi:photosystem II stability/assembly factor-like uncharacterized protein
MDSYYDDGGCCIVHPDSANIILTGGKGPSTQTNWSFVVSYSLDSGVTWTRCNPTPASAGFCHAMAVAPAQTNVVYAGGEVAGAGAVYRSTDFGLTWTMTAAAPADTVFGIAIHPADANRVFAATPSGTYYTTDGGTSWTGIGGGTQLKAIKMHPLDPDTVYIGGDNGVFVSHDAGGTWTAMNAGLDGRKVTSLGFAGQDGLLLLAGTAGGSCYAWQLATGIAENGNPKPKIQNPKSSEGTVRPNPFVACCRIVGHERDEFRVFDHSGRQVGVARGDKIGAGLPAGVYFARGAQAQAQAQAIGPIRIVKTR